MNRLYHPLLIGTSCLILFLAGDCQLSIAKGKKKAPVTLVCKQVPLYPVGGNLWAWISYKHEYDDQSDCSTATTTSIIDYSEYEDFPEGCGPDCDIRFLPHSGKGVSEPTASHTLHLLPASPTARLDLYPPQSPVYCDQLKERFLKFGSGNTARFAKVFFLCASKTKSPAEPQSDAVFFWYGFEVRSLPSNVFPMELPHFHVNRREVFSIPDQNNPGKWTEGICREFSLVKHGGSQFLIRFDN